MSAASLCNYSVVVDGIHRQGWLGVCFASMVVTGQLFELLCLQSSGHFWCSLWLGVVVFDGLHWTVRRTGHRCDVVRVRVVRARGASAHDL